MTFRCLNWRQQDLSGWQVVLEATCSVLVASDWRRCRTSLPLKPPVFSGLSLFRYRQLSRELALLCCIIFSVVWFSIPHLPTTTLKGFKLHFKQFKLKSPSDERDSSYSWISVRQAIYLGSIARAWAVSLTRREFWLSTSIDGIKRHALVTSSV